MARYISPVETITDINGAPMVGAKLVFYATGTATLKTVYSDAALTIPITNPVTAVSSDAGAIYPDIYLDGVYKVVQQDDSGTPATADGAILWTRDPVGDVVTGNLELWLSDETYNIPEVVYASDDNYYISLTDANQGNEPSASPANWQLIPMKDMVGLANTQTLTNKTIASATFSGVQDGFIGDDVTINGAAGTTRPVRYTTSGVLRWLAYCSPAAETGSNAGSNYALNRYDDSGANLGTPLIINRDTGLVVIANDLTVSNNLTVSGTTVTLPAGSIVDAALSSTVTAAGTIWVQNRIAGAIIGAVGTYAYLGENTLTTTVAGGLQSGANLRFAGVNSTGSYTLAVPGGIASAGAGGTPSGTWRCMGYAYSAGGTVYPATMWLRIL